MADGQKLGTLTQSSIPHTQRSWRTAFGMLALVLSLSLFAPGAQAEVNFEWAAALSSPGSMTDNSAGHGIAVDGDGNVYITSSFHNTAAFGHFQLTSAGALDIFVTKQAPDGTFLWARAMGGTGDDDGYGIAVDDVGNVYTTGRFEGTVDFDPGSGIFELTSEGLFDIFVSKLDMDGDFVWARAMGGSNFAEGRDIAVDSAGNVYTTGWFFGTADFDPGPGSFSLTSAGIDDIFVSKLDMNGNFVWARAMGGTGSDLGWGIAVDEARNVYTTGHFQTMADFDPGPGSFDLTSAGGDDIFVSKLDADGHFVWARAMGSWSGDQGRDIAVDNGGNVYTTGYFFGTADFDPGPGTFHLSSGWRRNTFVSKLDTDGEFIWARAMGRTGSAIGWGIAVDEAGNVCTTGHFQFRADFDPGPGTFELTPTGVASIFVAKLDTDGDFVWARAFGGTGYDMGLGIAVDGTGSVYATGRFSDTANFDPGPSSFYLTAAGIRDNFVVKLGPADVTPPNAIITPATTGPTNATTVDFAVTFDEAIMNFADASDLVITHTGTTSTGAAISGGPVAYTVTIDGISGDGSFTLAVDTTSGVSDLAGNVLASSVTSVPVVIDNTPPMVTVLGVSPHALAPGDTALIQFAVNEMLLADPMVQVAGTQAAPAPLESTKSLGHTYAWTAPVALPVGQITGRPLIPGYGYVNPDPWPYGPQLLQITVTDLAGNTTTHTDPHGLALVSGLPAAWPLLAALALLSAAAFTFRSKRRTTTSRE